MANRVISIKSSQLSSNFDTELYRDVSIISKPKLNNKREEMYIIDRLINVKAVMNSLTNIFRWLKGERVINPEFGSDLRKLLYEGITPTTEELIVAEINQCVNRWEPRVIIEKVQNISTVNDTEDNTINLNILFKIKGLDEIYNKQLKFNKDE